MNSQPKSTAPETGDVFAITDNPKRVIITHYMSVLVHKATLETTKTLSK